MTWTTDKPSETGWYWTRNHDHEDDDPFIVQVTRHHTDGLRVDYVYTLFTMPLKEIEGDTEWMGPIRPEGE
jgi:hypothetical protein